MYSMLLFVIYLSYHYFYSSFRSIKIEICYKGLKALLALVFFIYIALLYNKPQKYIVNQ